MGPDSLYYGEWRKFYLKWPCDLDLGPAMSNIELVRYFLYTTMFSNIMLLDRLLFELSCKNTHTHTDSDEYSIAALCKNATIIMGIVLGGGERGAVGVG